MEECPHIRTIPFNSSPRKYVKGSVKVSVNKEDKKELKQGEAPEME